MGLREGFIEWRVPPSTVAVGGGEPVQIVWSHYLGQGSEAGFAFVFRPGRLIGAGQRTTATVVLGISSLLQTETQPALWATFRQDQPTSSRDLRVKDELKDFFGISKPEKAVRFEKSTTVVSVTKDPDEIRRIAAELGINPDTLTLPPASRPSPVASPDSGHPPGPPVGPDSPTSTPDRRWVALDSAKPMGDFWTTLAFEAAAARLVGLLEAAKVFELTADQIQRIEIVPPVGSVPGRIVIRTSQDVQVVNVVTPAVPAEDPIPPLLPRFEELAPGRVVRPS